MSSERNLKLSETVTGRVCLHAMSAFSRPRNMAWHAGCIYRETGDRCPAFLKRLSLSLVVSDLMLAIIQCSRLVQVEHYDHDLAVGCLIILSLRTLLIIACGCLVIMAAAMVNQNRAQRNGKPNFTF